MSMDATPALLKRIGGVSADLLIEKRVGRLEN